MKHKFAYKWTLKDANFTKDKGKVFSCFACGGGVALWGTNSLDLTLWVVMRLTQE